MTPLCPALFTCFLRELRESDLISLNSNRILAWKARWDGQVAGTMPLPTDPDPAERMRYAVPPLELLGAPVKDIRTGG